MIAGDCHKQRESYTNSDKLYKEKIKISDKYTEYILNRCPIYDIVPLFETCKIFLNDYLEGK